MNQSLANPVWDVLIIGAGPAGLTAGYLLSKSNQTKLNIKLIEANPSYVGGISRTEEYNHFRFDIGGHRFFSKSAEIEALWTELLPNDFLYRPRSSRIFYQKKFYTYPLNAMEVVKNLGLWESICCVVSYLAARLRPIKNPKSFHDWVSNQFGERLFQLFFKTYTEKVWGMSCDDISADWAAQRIKGLNLTTTILAAIHKTFTGSTLKSNTIKTLIDHFRYPRKGPGMLWENTKNKIIAQGANVELGVRAHQYRWQNKDQIWAIDTTNTNGIEKTYYARHVISSVALRDVVTNMQPPAKSADIAEKLQYRDFITVAIMLNTPALFLDNWIYIHDPGVKVGRIQNFAAWSPEMVPNEQTGCLGLEYFCFNNDGLWSSSDNELIELAISELQTLGLVKRSQIIDGKVIRQSKAYPIYDSEYKQIVSTIAKEFSTNYPRFHFVGRNGLHKYNNQDHAMMTAILTVENILAGKNRFNVFAVNEDAGYHEEHDRQNALDNIRSVPQAQ